MNNVVAPIHELLKLREQTGDVNHIHSDTLQETGDLASTAIDCCIKNATE
jgi:hypothetical protein